MTTVVSTLITIFQLCGVHIIVSASCPVLAPTIATKQVPDYYWRDYVGIIPDDAIQGGTDKAGNPTYVGQAYIRNFELLPVIIYPGCKNANTTAYSNEITTDKNIKILCALNKEYFEWVPTKTEETHLLINHHLVVGGSEIGHNLNIGRVQHDEQIVIGKVFSYPLENSGLWIPYNGKPIRFISYEILTYNHEKATKPSLDVNIDVRLSQ